jgi:hypothetical protein
VKDFWAGEMGNRVLRTPIGAGLKVARMYQESIFPKSMSQRNSSGSHPVKTGRLDASPSVGEASRDHVVGDVSRVFQMMPERPDRVL